MPSDPRAPSALEWEIMDVIWEMGGQPSVREVLERAYPRGEKAYTTVQTVMNNLVDKGYLSKDKIGLVNFYTPLRPRHELVNGEVRRFVDRIFNGSFPAMADYLVRSKNLSRAELDELKHLIEEFEARKRKGSR
jgi:predicted transcriptional regulator